MTDDAIWQIEKQLWLDGPGVYDNLMDPACLMAFPGIGVLRAADIIDSLKQAPRWTDVKMTARSLSLAGDNVIVLAYEAEGHRPSAPVYLCYCTSTYRRAGENWLLVQHQQTPKQ